MTRSAAESLKQLTEKLADRIARSKRVNIPICMWQKDRWNDNPGQIRMGIVIGIHGGNNNLLVKFDDEPKPQQVGYGNFFDPKNADKLRLLSQALNDAEAAFKDFEEKHRIDARKKVLEALSQTGDDEDLEED